MSEQARLRRHLQKLACVCSWLPGVPGGDAGQQQGSGEVKQQAVTTTSDVGAGQFLNLAGDERAICKASRCFGVAGAESGFAAVGKVRGCPVPTQAWQVVLPYSDELWKALSRIFSAEDMHSLAKRWDTTYVTSRLLGRLNEEMTEPHVRSTSCVIWDFKAPALSKRQLLYSLTEYAPSTDETIWLYESVTDATAISRFNASLPDQRPLVAELLAPSADRIRRVHSASGKACIEVTHVVTTKLHGMIPNWVMNRFLGSKLLSAAVHEANALVKCAILLSEPSKDE